MIYKVNPGSPLFQEYVVPNPEYITRVKQNLWIGNTKPKTFLGSSDEQYFPPSVPYLAQCLGQQIESMLPPKKYEPLTTLRPHQQTVFDEIKDYKSGLIELRTGAGKSVLAGELCRYWGGNTLFVLHAVEMIEQFKEMFKTFFDIDVGEYHGEKKEIKPITLTTFNSAVTKKKEFETYGFQNLLVDECDTFFTPKRRDFVCTFDSERKFGMTGTTDTNYGKNALELFWGKHATATVTDDIPLKHVYRSVLKHDDAPDDVSDWQTVRTHLYNSKERLQHILWDVHNTYQLGDFYIVLLDRVDHVDWIYEALARFTQPAYKNHGGLKPGERQKHIEQFKKTGGVLVAQYKTTGRGFDVPECNKIYIGFPNKQASGLRQIVGRACRVVEDKESVVYDLVDYHLWFQYRAREKTYKQYFGITPEPIPR